MYKNTPLFLIISVLLLILILSVSMVLSRNGSIDSPDSTENTPTAVTDTEPPTEPPTEGPTQIPTDPDKEYIGTLYTREELEAMSTKYDGYGPGIWGPGVRAKYAVWDQEKYGKYGANFIAPDNGNIYLTFDCGYEYYYTDTNGNRVSNTGVILDTLRKRMPRLSSSSPWIS